MNKSIKPPEWFDLKKYNDSSTKNIEQWILNFRPRVMALNCLDNKVKIDNYILGDILKFRDNGFIISDNLFPYQHYNQTFVKSVTTSDVVMLNNLIPESIKKDTKNYLNNGGNITKEMESSISELEWFNEIDDCYAHININAPVEIIINDFKLWLSKRKKELNTAIGYKTKIDITPAKMGEWFNLKIIPYMDLLIWMKEEELSIQYRFLAEWLYPEEINTVKTPVDIEARIGRTLKAHIDDICKYEFLEYQEIKNSRILRKKYKSSSK